MTRDEAVAALRRAVVDHQYVRHALGKPDEPAHLRILRDLADRLERGQEAWQPEPGDDAHVGGHNHPCNVFILDLSDSLCGNPPAPSRKPA